MQKRKMRGLIKRKADSKKSGEEWMTEKFVFESVSEKPMVILFQAADYADLTYVRFFFIQDNWFLGSPRDESTKMIRNAEIFVRRFAVKLYRKAIEDEIAEENVALTKLEKKFQKLKRIGKKLRQKMANKKDEYFGELVVLDDPVKIDGIEKEQKGQARKLKDYEKKMKRNYKEQKDIKNQIESQKKEIEKWKSNLKDIE